MSKAALRNTLSIGVAAALLPACAVRQTPSEIPQAASALRPQTGMNERHFRYTGAKQSFLVPEGVTKLTVVADGAKGGGEVGEGYDQPPGLGGSVSAVVPVTPREKLYVFVGGTPSGRAGGFNGGGSGSGYYAGAGASDIREGGEALKDRIIVAGGGGGAGESAYAYSSASGGNGGGTIGEAGADGSGSKKWANPGSGGGGGTQTSGGAGGLGGRGHAGTTSGGPGGPGSLGDAGNGGSGGAGYNGYGGGPGGGGGGGYYGGGGGSSYVEHKIKHYTSTQGTWAHENGLVILRW